MIHNYPILEFDPTQEAIIEPAPYPNAPDLPEHAVACFFHEVLDELLQSGQLRIVHHLSSGMGRHPVYEMMVDDKPIAVFHPGIGAPLAAAFLEEMIAHGCRKFIACGGCGVLDKNIECGNLVVVNSAVRDEGTSYHYLPPGREVTPSISATESLKSTLDSLNLPYILAKTWTTDAFYRETKKRILQRASEGCKTVEMEAAAFFAVAQFRNVELGQLLYGGDDVSGEVWDSRSWRRDISHRQKVFLLAAQACANL